MEVFILANFNRRRNSFEQLDGWLEEIHNCADPSIVIVVVGNKSTDSSVESYFEADCPDREISTAEARDWASRNELLFIETSYESAEPC